MENYYYNYNQYDFNSFGSEAMQNNTTSNYHEYHGNNHVYNQPCNDYSMYYGYYSNEPRYVQYHQSECYENAYQHCPSPSLIGYYHQSLAYDQHESAAIKTVRFCDPVSSEIKKMSSSTTEAHDDDDLEFEEYNPHPFKGGYDISEKYGKPLPPSNETCYPPSKVEANPSLEDHSYESIPSPYGKASEPEGDIEKEEDDEDEDEDEEEEEEKDDNESRSELDDQSDEELEEEQASQGDLLHDQNEEEKEEQESQGDVHDQNGGKEIVAVRQIPPGYGLEAMDLCEGVFGGYFPCLWKRKQGSNNSDQSCGGNETVNYDYYWKGSADYLFGNPNPYGEPVYSYQRHYPQQSVCGQVIYGGDSSWLQFHN